MTGYLSYLSYTCCNLFLCIFYFIFSYFYIVKYSNLSNLGNRFTGYHIFRGLFY